jgi:hypothetical protein
MINIVNIFFTQQFQKIKHVMVVVRIFPSTQRSKVQSFFLKNCQQIKWMKKYKYNI